MFVDRLWSVKLLQLPFKWRHLLLHCCLWAELFQALPPKSWLWLQGNLWIQVLTWCLILGNKPKLIWHQNNHVCFYLLHHYVDRDWLTAVLQRYSCMFFLQEDLRFWAVPSNTLKSKAVWVVCFISGLPWWSNNRFFKGFILRWALFARW